MGDTEYASGFKRAIAEAVRIIEDRLYDEVTRGESATGMAQGASFTIQDELEECLAAVQKLSVDKEG